MWSVEAEGEIPVDPAEVWARYVEPSTWVDWAHNLQSVRFDGPVAIGTEGRIKPSQGPEQVVTITRLEPGRVIETEVHPPGARMTFRYVLEPTAGGTRARHTITMSGPLAFLYQLMIRKRNERQLGEEIERLARLLG